MRICEYTNVRMCELLMLYFFTVHLIIVASKENYYEGCSKVKGVKANIWVIINAALIIILNAFFIYEYLNKLTGLFDHV